MAIIHKFKKRACQDNDSIPKVTLIAIFPEGSRTQAFFRSLEDDAWNIVSYDANTREVCIELITASGNRLISVTLPEIAANF